MAKIVRRLDELQRRWKATSVLWAVQKKYGDDSGGYLCALITYYGFMSVFPLLLAAFTIVAYALSGDHSAAQTLERHIGQYPIIGPAAKELEGRTLRGRPLGLIVGVLGLVWGAQGLAQAVQFASMQAWNVRRSDRPGYLPRLLDGLSWYVVFGVGALVATFVTSLGSLLHWSGGTAVSTLVVIVFDIGLFWLCFKMVGPHTATWKQHLPGAVVAGAAWAILTGVGVGLAHSLAHTNTLYGAFAPVLGLLTLIYLMARISILSVEANAVRSFGLWPRSLTADDPTPADLSQLKMLVTRETRQTDNQESPEQQEVPEQQEEEQQEQRS